MLPQRDTHTSPSPLPQLLSYGFPERAGFVGFFEGPKQA